MRNKLDTSLQGNLLRPNTNMLAIRKTRRSMVINEATSEVYKDIHYDQHRKTIFSQFMKRASDHVNSQNALRMTQSALTSQSKNRLSVFEMQQLAVEKLTRKYIPERCFDEPDDSVLSAK
jgi:hypothetical protein